MSQPPEKVYGSEFLRKTRGVAFPTEECNLPTFAQNSGGAIPENVEYNPWSFA